MKKILSLLTALTLTASGASSVISCSNSSKPPGTSDKERAKAISEQLDGKTVSFQEVANNKKVSQYKNEIQSQLNGVVDQTIAYSFDFKDENEGGKTLSTTKQDIAIKIKVGDDESDVIKIKVGFSDISDQQKADDIKTALAKYFDKSGNKIQFQQDGTAIKASAYTTQIQTKLNGIVKQTPTAYSFDFDGSGDTTLSTKQVESIAIKIKVGKTSSKGLKIKVQFSDKSDKQLANDIATQLETKIIEVKQKGVDVLANKYNNAILAGLKEKVTKDITTPFGFEFATDKDKNKTLSTAGTIDISIKIKVGSAESDAITINVGFSDSSDLVKANVIAKKLKDQTYKFQQVDLKTKASDYESEIQGSLNAQVKQTPTAYSFIFNNTSGNTPLSKAAAKAINIKIKVGSAESDAITINVQFSAKSDLATAEEIATALNKTTKKIEFNQDGRKTKANDYKVAIENGLHGLVPTTTYGDYGFKFKSDGDKDITTDTKTFTIQIQIGVATSNTEVILNIKFSDSSDEAKADAIADKLKDKIFTFDQDGLKNQAKDYTTQIQDIFNIIAPQRMEGAYSFKFATIAEGNKTLSKGLSKIVSIQILYKSTIASKTINIKLSFGKLSDQQIAKDTANALKDKSIEFMQSGIKTKASDYTTEIQAQLVNLVPQTTPNYKFEFNGSGDTPLTKTEQDISIKIKVNSAESSAFNIKVKFSDWSNQQKVKDIENNITITNINVPSGTDTDTSNSNTIKAIKTSLQTANPTLSNDDLTKITFSKTSLKVNTPVEVDATITVGDYSSPTPIKLQVTLTRTDQQKADAMVTTLNSKGKITNTLNIDGTKQGFNDYTSQIKAELNKILTTQEQGYNYSLVYTGTNKINNISQAYNGIKIKVGSATSTNTFDLNLSFNYKKLTGTAIPDNAPTNVINVIDNKVYVGTDNGLYISNDKTSYQVATGITTNAKINTIKKIGTKIFVGTDKGIFEKNASDTGVAFTLIAGTENYNVRSLAFFNSKIYAAAGMKGLLISSDATGTSFSAVGGDWNSRNVTALALAPSGNKLFIGTNGHGLYSIDSSSEAGTTITIGGDTRVNSIVTIGTDTYVTTQSGTNGIYISSDDGVSFTSLPGWENKTNVNTITKIDGKLYVGTGHGLYVQSGSNYEQYLFGQTNIVVPTIAKIENKIYVGTYVGIYYNFLS